MRQQFFQTFCEWGTWQLLEESSICQLLQAQSESPFVLMSSFSFKFIVVELFLAFVKTKTKNKSFYCSFLNQCSWYLDRTNMSYSRFQWKIFLSKFIANDIQTSCVWRMSTAMQANLSIRFILLNFRLFLREAHG